jgi:hypothetical protein
VISLKNNSVYAIFLDSLQLTQFTLTKAFNTFSSGIRISITNSPIETLIIVDTIRVSLAMAINYTKLRNIPPTLSLFQGNMSLYFGYNEIQYIPPEIMNLRIYQFDVQYNKICSASDSLNQWIAIKSQNDTWKNTQNCR